MAKIQRIGLTYSHPFLLLLFFGYKEVTRGKNKLPYAQYTSDPKDSESPLKILAGGSYQR